jgi:hypothetical protein
MHFSGESSSLAKCSVFVGLPSTAVEDIVIDDKDVPWTTLLYSWFGGQTTSIRSMIIFKSEAVHCPGLYGACVARYTPRMQVQLS